MKLFMMDSDEERQAIARIGAQAITAVERARLAVGQRLAEDERKAAEVRAQLFTDWQASTQAAGRQLLEKNQQALAATGALALALVRKLAADQARLN